MNHQHHTTSRANGKAIVFHIPASVDLDRVHPDRRDHAAFILHTIGSKVVRWQADDAGWVNLKFDYLRNILTRSVWPSLRREMVGQGLIKCDGRFTLGKKCYSYRLMDTYEPTKPVVCSDSGIRRRLMKARQEYERRLSPVDRWLRANLLMLNFDATEAQRVIASMTPRADSPLSVSQYRGVVRNSIARFDRRTGDFLRDEYGRRHSIVTRLPREMRCCLTVNGESLIGLDVANSQPLFCGLAVIDFIQKQATAKESDRECSEPMRMTATIQAIANQCIKRQGGRETVEGKDRPPLITTAHLSEGGKVKRVAERVFGDLRQYLDLCEAGRLYEALMELGEDRDIFKRRAFADVYYGTDRYPSELRDRFRARFPTVAKRLKAMKKKNYRAAAHSMQRKESKLIIDTICGRIMRGNPGVPIISIHDSLATLPQHVEYVRDIMLQEFERLGVRPLLKQEPFDSKAH